MQYCKINGTEYPAISFFGRGVDNDWDGRETVTIHIRMTYSQASARFVDGVSWSIIDENVNETTSEVTRTEFDYSEYSMAGDITDHRDGTVSVKMGKETDLEAAYELLYGGVLS